MRLAGADWAVEDEVLVLPDELGSSPALRVFAAKQRRNTANVLEDVPQALADTFRRLTTEYLREAVIAVQK